MSGSSPPPNLRPPAPAPRKPRPDNPGSPAQAPILAQMHAIDAELARRAASRQPGGSQRHDSAVRPGPPGLRPMGRGPRDARGPRPAPDLTPNGTRADAAAGTTAAPVGVRAAIPGGPRRCHGGRGFTGGHLLHVAAADCNLNDLYRKPRRWASN